MIDIENMKYIVEQEVKKRHFARAYITFSFDEINVFLGHFIFIRKMENFMLMVDKDRSYIVGHSKRVR